MKRILPVLCVLSLGFAAYACKSSSDKSNGGSNPGQNGSSANPAGSAGAAPGAGTDPNNAPTAAEMNTDPTAGVPPATVILEAGEYTDGPVWNAAVASIFFTTPLGEGALYRMSPDGSVIKVRDGSKALGTTPIGNAANGPNVFTTEAKQLVRATADGGAPVVLASSWAMTGAAAPAPPTDGGVADPTSGPFDTLKDIAARKDGTVYVTDPGYFATPIANRIYKVDPTGKVQVVESFDDVPRPTGIALTPDQSSLFVGFAAPESGTLPFIRKYAINADGSVGEWKKFADVGPSDSEPDGLAVDKVGNVYVATKAGVEAFKPDGTRWGAIGIPEKPTGIAFGGTDLKTIFVTTEGVHIYTLAGKLAGVAQ